MSAVIHLSITQANHTALTKQWNEGKVGKAKAIGKAVAAAAFDAAAIGAVGLGIAALLSAGPLASLATRAIVAIMIGGVVAEVGAAIVLTKSRKPSDSKPPSYGAEGFKLAGDFDRLMDETNRESAQFRSTHHPHNFDSDARASV